MLVSLSLTHRLTTERKKNKKEKRKKRKQKK